VTYIFWATLYISMSKFAIASILSFRSDKRGSCNFY